MSDTVSDISLDDLSERSFGSDDYQLAQQEWEESIHQLQQLFSIVLLPLLGRYLGRRWSYWAYSRYIGVGLRGR
ncbi:uncharacterized protein ARMOST_08875 [Armillaria ostoyae]|uniref:Uncharacterized protein n=1 Tax=Armillaria ostoyae TaxID=47428 RepID=A0A284R9V3_ARMOS|nr:uncharacterized protein ARMOST_08875 [Armillaria ostoyae]